MSSQRLDAQTARFHEAEPRPGRELGRDVPRWSLWLVAIVCFGPLALVLLLGIIALPLWVGMLAVPQDVADEPSRADLAWPILLVVSGIIGFAGLFRVLTLPRGRRPESNRVFTIGMVTVGLTALGLFDLGIIAGILSEPSEGIPVAGILVYIALPFGGAAWLLSKSWKYLFATPVGEDLDDSNHGAER